ncbi:MAG: hypothetical protein IJP22_02065 [Clostridia bacterium]|nr:hypothetical protein [Clostridia bacterium]
MGEEASKTKRSGRQVRRAPSERNVGHRKSASKGLPLRETVQIRSPQPTMRIEKDIGSKNPETTAVSGFFMLFFKVEFKRYHFPKTTFGEDLN